MPGPDLNGLTFIQSHRLDAPVCELPVVPERSEPTTAPPDLNDNVRSLNALPPRHTGSRRHAHGVQRAQPSARSENSAT